MKRYYIFRNFTLESYFSNLDASFSGYGDILNFPKNHDYYIWFYHPPYKTNQSQLVDEINDYSIKLSLLADNINKSSTFVIIQLSARLLFYFTEESRWAIEEAVYQFNKITHELSKKYSNIKILSLDGFINLYTPEELINWKYYYLSQMIFSPSLSSEFQKWFGLRLDAINNIRKKCLVLDLDNTLWGGVLGEDGVNGIRVGNTYPGSAFRDFQLDLLEASKHGVILTICSKNNEADVLEAWEKNPYLVLKKEHFSAWRINWKEKYINIQEIATELNIGLDSVVFIDDNPVERDMVKNYLPEVVVPDFPKHPYFIHDFFQQTYNTYLYAYKLTSEDSKKTKQYIENRERSKIKQQFASMEDYWKSLEMILSIEPLSDVNVARIAQMTQKTNQFNLTTKRYSETDITSFKNKGLVYCLSVKDKFGDNGITALCIVTVDSQVATIDSYLLSCRILGRGVEKVFISSILNILYSRKIHTVRASYIKTAKNSQVANFYDQLGFSVDPLSKGDDNEKKYILEMSNPLKKYSYCKVEIYE